LIIQCRRINIGYNIRKCCSTSPAANDPSVSSAAKNFAAKGTPHQWINQQKSPLPPVLFCLLVYLTKAKAPARRKTRSKRNEKCITFEKWMLNKTNNLDYNSKAKRSDWHLHDQSIKLFLWCISSFDFKCLLLKRPQYMTLSLETLKTINDVFLLKSIYYCFSPFICVYQDQDRIKKRLLKLQEGFQIFTASSECS